MTWRSHPDFRTERSSDADDLSLLARTNPVRNRRWCEIFPAEAGVDLLDLARSLCYGRNFQEQSVSSLGIKQLEARDERF